MEEITAKESKSDAVAARVRQGKCLIAGCEQEIDRRGLCSHHYLQFLKTKKDQPMRERARFERDLIREGLVLAPGAIRDLTSDNPFANVG